MRSRDDASQLPGIGSRTGEDIKKPVSESYELRYGLNLYRDVEIIITYGCAFDGARVCTRGAVGKLPFHWQTDASGDVRDTLAAHSDRLS